MSNIYLIGFMGAGKSTIGRHLAARISATFKDIDALIEAESKTTIKEVFATRGEPFFRDLETACLKDLTQYSNLVVATGGGITERSENRKLLDSGTTVFLDVEWPLIQQRLAGTSNRPLASSADNWDGTYQLYCRRLPFYRQADLIIDCGSDSPEQIAGRIIDGLKI